MGQIYSYRVYVESAHAPGLFSGLARHLRPDDIEGTGTVLRFGDGRSVTVPCTNRFEEDSTVPVDGTPESIDAFDLDLVMHFDGVAAPVGCIYVTYDVHGGPGSTQWLFSFSAATTRMSYQLEDTPAIRDAFAGLAMASEATLCVLHRERLPQIVVTDGKQRLDEFVPGPRWDSLDQLLAR